MNGVVIVLSIEVRAHSYSSNNGDLFKPSLKLFVIHTVFKVVLIFRVLGAELVVE
jgi:hypothetical protein